MSRETSAEVYGRQHKRVARVVPLRREDKKQLV